MSRSFVGSSRTSTLAGCVSRRARSSRLRSPPESAFTGDRARSGGNRKSSRYPCTCGTRRRRSPCRCRRPWCQRPFVPGRAARAADRSTRSTRRAASKSPRSGAQLPTSIRSSVVLPAPFGPISPTRSPRMMRVRSRGRGTSPKDLVMLRLEHDLPVDRPRRPIGRTDAPAARRAPRASHHRLTRPSSRVRRALTPRRTHTSSCASFLSNFASASASFASHASFFSRNVR